MPNPAASPLTDRFRSVRIAVIGDVMLDHHVVGRVNRISAEAPVPVLLAQTERRALGGAANVAANIASLGGKALLVGLIGADAAGNELAELIAAHPNIEPRLIAAPGRPTITKTRYISGQYQLLRVDRERAEPAPPAAKAALLNEIDDAIAACDLAVVSDYGKGVLGDDVLAAIFAAAANRGRPTIVDPKRVNLADYRGATFITPNRRELTAATSMPCETDNEAAEAAKAAMHASGAAILLTRSEKGMALYRADKPPIMLPAEAREVFDVSGAGDTVVAALALGLAAGLPAEQAMRVANAAAAVVVGKLGAAVVSPGELAEALRSQGRGAAFPLPPQDGAVTSIERALAQRDRWRAEGLVVGFTNGCFDLVHAGHVSLVAQSAAACDRLIVALNSDASVRRLKGPTRPVQPLEARAAVMSGMKGVDMVVAFEEDTPIDLIRALAPDVLIKGADYKESDVVGADLVKSWGGRLVLAELAPGHSTTALVQKAKT